KRYGITYERKRVRVLDTVPTDAKDSVKETNTYERNRVQISGDSDSVPIPSHAAVSTVWHDSL
ncbi:hypothetical protein A2U01_0104012, partial [Trifolium medium]|nr:hypothetical protein [Trifolium medium]